MIITISLTPPDEFIRVIFQENGRMLWFYILFILFFKECFDKCSCFSIVFIEPHVILCSVYDSNQYIFLVGTPTHIGEILLFISCSLNGNRCVSCCHVFNLHLHVMTLGSRCGISDHLGSSWCIC